MMAGGPSTAGGGQRWTPRAARAKWTALATLLLAPPSVAPGCGGGGRTAASSTQVRVVDAWPVPALPGEPGAWCADVGTLRACWAAAAASLPPRLVARPLPRLPASSPLGWRCGGQGAARVCRDRRLAAPPFQCAGARCEQRLPRMPDDGDWSCADMGGAAICHAGERAAGVAPAAPDVGWICGARGICVDLSPDFPDGDMTGWRCRYLHDNGARRVCERAGPAAHQLTDTCDGRRPCLDGSRCVDGRCLPARPDPACWLDPDCPGGGYCRFGSCV